MSSTQAEKSRLSLNQITTDTSTLADVVEACARQEIRWIGAWRHKIRDSPAQAGKLIRDAGLRVSSLCRGGWNSHSRLHGRDDSESRLKIGVPIRKV